MLQLLFLLSHYSFVYSKNSSSYFQKFSFLEYGFKKNAKFNIDFGDSIPDMIFGFATKKEINEINKIKDSQNYCNGSYQLSYYQFDISNTHRVQGVINSKSILTPYAFTCSKSYSIHANIEITNDRSHIDYRVQDLTIVSLIFAIIVTIVTISYFVYSILQYFSQNRYYRFLISVFFVFVFISFQNIIAFIFFKYLKNCNCEYFNEKTSVKSVSMFIWSHHSLR